MGLLKSIAPSVVSSVIGGGFSLFGQKSANEASARSVARQMAFQKQAYQNRYQWQMEDMRKAGLNPILAYRQAPPGAPSGASMQYQNEGAAGVSGAVAAARVAAELKLIKEQARKTKLEGDVTERDAKIRGYQVKALEAVEDAIGGYTHNSSVEVRRQAPLPGARVAPGYNSGVDLKRSGLSREAVRKLKPYIDRMRDIKGDNAVDTFMDRLRAFFGG